jgi:predicted MFS family arabinose efflux permease
MGMMALPFLVLYLTKHLGVPALVAALAISTYGAGGMLTGPIAGRLSDRIGPFAVMRGSLALTGVVLLVLPLAHSVAFVLVLTFLWAVVGDATRPATMSALTAATPPEQRRAAIALNRLATNLGMSIGPAAGGFLALVSFPLVFVVDGLTSLAAAAVLTTLLRLHHRARVTTGYPATGTVAGGGPVYPASPAVWRDRAALRFFATAFLVNAVFMQQEAAMPLYIVRDLHFRESFFGGLFVLNTLIIVAIEVPLNIAMARWRTHTALVLATVLVAVGFGGLAAARTAMPIAITVIIWTFAEMIFYPTGTAYVAELAPPARTGEYMGAFSSTFSLALVVGPWAGTALLDRFGAVVTWCAMLAVGLGAAALFGLSGFRSLPLVTTSPLQTGLPASRLAAPKT